MGRWLSEAEILATRFGIKPRANRNIRINGPNGARFITETREGRAVNKAGLVVRINGTGYRAWIGTHRVELTDKGGERTVVSIRGLGREDRCTCQGWDEEGDCVHLGALRALRIIPGVRRPVGMVRVGEGIEEAEGWDERPGE